ncbi:hypothetical protein Agub_g14587 [Astrephomene gubernaculifera]|uniref:Transmembrane protein 230 n=1 Tax=Astrephomene gubernaculifera TaxID=47775 RepID=A0AAD3E1M7_9CHLO|nr:hypothetical protein Agub_g14587 [Astrephomene gubernaculifera]
MRTRSGYTRLPPDHDEYSKGEDLRFKAPEPEVPKASIALAIFLMVFGIFAFVAAWLHFTQRVLGKEQAEIGFTILGFMTFMPGAYHTYLAYGAWKRWPGFRWDSIPQF